MIELSRRDYAQMYGPTTGDRVRLGDTSLLIWGDIVHFPTIQTTRTSVSVAFDVDPEQARQTRECLLRQAASEQWLIAGMHLGLPGFARVVVQGFKTRIQFANHLVQHRFGNGRIAAISVQQVPLFVQILQQVRLQVGTRSHVHDFEQCGQGKVVVKVIHARCQLMQAHKQVFKP